MKRFMASPAAATEPGSPILADLISAWGNEGWSARDEFLAECVKRALRSPGPILECGSGLSTLLIGVVATQRGQRHWALEHLPTWAVKVQGYLDRYQLDAVRIIGAPLRDYGGFCWYDAPMASLPDQFALVICDGPPGDVEGGRYGLVPMMRDRLRPGCTILLDDAGREQEVEIADRWRSELGAAVQSRGIRKPYLELTVLDRQTERHAYRVAGGDIAYDREPPVAADVPHPVPLQLVSPRSYRSPAFHDPRDRGSPA